MASFFEKIVTVSSEVIASANEALFSAASFTSVPRMNNVSFPFPDAVPTMVSARIITVSTVVVLISVFAMFCDSTLSVLTCMYLIKQTTFPENGF